MQVISGIRETPNPLHLYLFIALNAVDVALTVKALSLGASEINCVFGTFEHPLEMAAVKMILVGAILLGLVALKRIYLMHWLNAGMALVVVWNVAAVLTWSLPLMN